MSKDIISADSLGPDDSPELAGAVILSGDDRLKVGHVYQSADDAMVSKSLRLPAALYDRAIAAGHPNGFSGVVRDALEQFLVEGDADSIKHALSVLNRAASRLDQAA